MQLENITQNKREKFRRFAERLGDPRIYQRNPNDRDLLRSWINGLGVSSAHYMRWKPDTLATCYTAPRYLAAVLASLGCAEYEISAALSRVSEQRSKLWGDDSLDGRTITEITTRALARQETPQEPAQEPTQEPAQETPQEPAQEPAQEQSDDDSTRVAQAIQTLSEILGPRSAAAIDEDQIEALVRRLVSAELAKREESRVVRLTVEHDGGHKADIGQCHKDTSTLLACARARVHAMLVGPAGSGKSHAAEQVSEALSLPYYFTNAVLTEFALLGYMDATGKYVRTPFREAFEHGGLFCFDEVDASSARALLTLNMALANGAMAFPDAIIKKHPDFVVVAAANTFGTGKSREYVGRSQLDAAFLNRFATINWQYDEALERALIGPEFLALADYFHEVRAFCARENIRVVVSLRNIMHAKKLLQAGLAMPDVLSMVLFNGMDSDTSARIARNIAAPTIETAHATAA